MADPVEGKTGGSADFDFAYFDNYTSGDEALQREVLQLFFGQVDGLAKDLDPDGNAEDWRAGAHAIKGGARGTGLAAVAELCQQMETADDENPATRRASLESLMEGLDRARQGVEAQYQGIFEA